MSWASVFMRHSGAGYHGHVGWAFETRPGVSCVGAVENPSGWPVTFPGKKGQWYAEVPNNRVKEVMSKFNPGYESYKQIFVQHANIGAAWETLYNWENTPYSVLLKNCNNAVYDILSAYGVPYLPHYSVGRPQVWYEQIQVAQQYLNYRNMRNPGANLNARSISSSEEEDPYQPEEEQ